MVYRSNLAGLSIIDDHNYRISGHCGQGVSRGYEPRDYQQHPLAFAAIAKEFPLPVIPPNQWEAMIEHREKKGLTLRSMRTRKKIYSLNQAKTNYCWGNAVIQGMHYIMGSQGSKMIRLSPASVCAPIKNFRNNGGWGSQALEWIAEKGATAEALWPANAIEKKYYTEEARENAGKHIITEWWDLKPNSIEELVSCLLYGIPVAVGYNWWGHEVLAIDAVITPRGRIGVLIDNSWGSWGDKGLGVLEGDKRLPDEAVAVRVVTSAQE